MIYDVHNHVGLDLGFYLRGWWPYAATAQDMLQHLDANGIDRAVVFPFGLPSAFDPYAFAAGGEVRLCPGRAPFDRENEALLTELTRLDPARRLFMLAMFDPAREVERQTQALLRLFHRPEAEGRLLGLKVQATILESPIRALLREGRTLMQLAEARAMPVLVHTSILPADGWSQVDDCLEVAAAYPRARFNLAHSLRFHQRGLEQAARTANVWVDCAAHLAHCQLAREGSPSVAAPGDRVDADYAQPAQVLATLDAMLGGRYLWGSDNPFMSWCDGTIKAVYSYRLEAAALHALPAATKARMATSAPEAWLWGKS